jgi:hypothetical protein
MWFEGVRESAKSKALVFMFKDVHPYLCRTESCCKISIGNLSKRILYQKSFRPSAFDSGCFSTTPRCPDLTFLGVRCFEKSSPMEARSSDDNQHNSQSDSHDEHRIMIRGIIR